MLLSNRFSQLVIVFHELSHVLSKQALSAQSIGQLALVVYRTAHMSQMAKAFTLIRVEWKV